MIAKWNIAAYLCIGAALMLVLAITAWGAYVDFAEVRLTLLQAEMGRLRSHALRAVAKIEERLVTPGATLQSAIDGNGHWLREHWKRWIPGDKGGLWAAIVDPAGAVLTHMDPTKDGQRLAPRWYRRRVPEAGDDVVETDSRSLTDETAYVILMPILLHEKEVATYCSALDPDWFDEALAAKNSSIRARWLGIFSCTVIVVLVTSLSLFKIIQRTMQLRKLVEMSRVRQFAELGELAAGIAHEIRNPINAIRLDLHVLQRLQRPSSAQSDCESDAVIAEANREIARVEGLMRIMLDYARPEKAVNENLEVRGELEAVVSFLAPVFDRERVSVGIDLPPTPLYVHIDRSRFRQVIMNLLTSAKEAVDADGKVDICLRRRSGHVDVTISDNGAGLVASERELIFDPCYSAKELGTGLGLSLVKRFVEEAGGTISCSNNEVGGARFELAFPEAIGEQATIHTSSADPICRGPRSQNT